MGMVSSYLQGRGQIASAKANAQSTAMNAAASAANMRFAGSQAQIQGEVSELNYDNQADYYLRAAGNYQMQGREQREQRLVHLGQEKGDIIASAAGSGIDVTSRVVKKTTSDTVKSAYHDIATLAANEYEQTYGAVKAAKTARVNADNARSIGDWTQAAYSKLAGQTEQAGAISAKAQLKAGYDSAIASMVGGALSDVKSGIGLLML